MENPCIVQSHSVESIPFSRVSRQIVTLAGISIKRYRVRIQSERTLNIALNCSLAKYPGVSLSVSLGYLQYRVYICLRRRRQFEVVQTHSSRIGVRAGSLKTTF